jgi:hypothetical protein
MAAEKRSLIGTVYPALDNRLEMTASQIHCQSFSIGIKRVTSNSADYSCLATCEMAI